MNSQQPMVLIVDDKPQNLFALEHLLQELSVGILQTTSGAEALALALEHDFFVAIVDVQMPGMDGYELVDLLRGNESTATLPVIFVSAIYSDEYHHRKAYDAGAVDFLSKPFIPEILLSKVKVFLDLYQQRQKLQSLVGQLNAANAALSKRAVQLETSAQVGHHVTSILDLERLLAEVVDLIRDRFGYYFVGIWVRQPESGRAVLQACSSRQNCEPLKLGAFVSLEDEGHLIARVCRTAQAGQNELVDAGPTAFKTGALPGIVSQLALPLRIGKKLLGVLDIQSRQTAAFSAEDGTVLQSLADQIAIAIRNAQLYARVTALNNELEDKVRKRTAELEKTTHHLELLDRNKTAFIQVVSHELRTPLTLIKGFSQIMMRDPGIQNNLVYKQQVNGIVTGAERMREIVDSMLDMVKIDNQALDLLSEPVHLGDLFAALYRSLSEPLQERSLTLAFQEIDALPSIEADRDALYKMFTHLLLNAIKYTPDSGHIVVKGQRCALVPHASNLDAVEIVIQDTGIGIDPQALELIFTKFYRTDEATYHSTGRTKFKGGGQGLGLAISRGIVEAHGGRIWAESSGRNEATCPGSAFHVVLPLQTKLRSREELRRQLAGAL